jgi:hypothetical protein
MEMSDELYAPADLPRRKKPRCYSNRTVFSSVHCYVQLPTARLNQITKLLCKVRGEQPSHDTCVACWSVSELRG